MCYPFLIKFLYIFFQKLEVEKTDNILLGVIYFRIKFILFSKDFEYKGKIN